MALGIPDAHSCTSGNHRQMLQWVEIRKTSKRTWKAYAVAWGTWTTLVPPGHTHVCLYQQAEQAEPPSLQGTPGEEGASTSPVELAHPGPTIIHLHWKLHRYISMSGQNIGSAVHTEMVTGLGLSATLKSINSCEVTQPNQFVDKLSQLAEKSKQMRKRELKLKRSFCKTISRKESNPAEWKLFRRAQRS